MAQFSEINQEMKTPVKIVSRVNKVVISVLYINNCLFVVYNFLYEMRTMDLIVVCFISFVTNDTALKWSLFICV